VSAREDPAEAIAGILDEAAERGRLYRVPYAGLVLPTEAWQLAQAGAGSIVDVRTRPEWEFVGRVPESTLIEWRRYGDAAPNAQFLQELGARFDRDDTLLFLCRSAVRSHHAAAVAARAGFKHAFNVLEGFEGDTDDQGQRGRLGGWRKAGLPWIQD
jgi:rhodanese-related sulfurtransferase